VWILFDMRPPNSCRSLSSMHPIHAGCTPSKPVTLRTAQYKRGRHKPQHKTTPYLWVSRLPTLFSNYQNTVAMPNLLLTALGIIVLPSIGCLRTPALVIVVNASQPSTVPAFPTAIWTSIASGTPDLIARPIKAALAYASTSASEDVGPVPPRAVVGRNTSHPTMCATTSRTPRDAAPDHLVAARATLNPDGDRSGPRDHPTPTALSASLPSPTIHPRPERSTVGTGAIIACLLVGACFCTLPVDAANRLSYTSCHCAPTLRTFS
jgi:hypothetical protein